MLFTKPRKYIILILFFIINIIFAQQQKIISLAPGYTYQMHKLEKGEAIIANTTYCNNPKKAQKKIKIGSIVNINVEQIYALQPDLVISSTLTRKNQIEKLQQLGLQVDIFERPRSFTDIIKQYQNLAELVNQQGLANAQLDSIKQIINHIQSKAQSKRTKQVFFQIGSDPLYAANPTSFINDLIKIVNCENIVETKQTGAFSREEIVAKNPDIIFIALNGEKNKIEKEKWQKYKSLVAVKNKRIYTVDPNIFCTPTPFTFSQALIKMVKIVHPNMIINYE